VIAWLGADDFPAHRREPLLERLAWQAQSRDPVVLATLVADRAVRPCPIVIGESVRAECAAVLGDDGRYHLRLDGRFICATIWQGRRKPPPPALPHEQRCPWWSADGIRYRVNPPTGVSLQDGLHGRVTVRWAVMLTEHHIDPALVPKRGHCPINEARGNWPPYRDARLAPIVNALVEALGPACHACHGALGVFVDHDPVTLQVRGLTCRHCNTTMDSCPHLSGCPWAAYLNNPPAAPLSLTYPRAALSRRPSEDRLLLTLHGDAAEPFRLSSRLLEHGCHSDHPH
jgi:hypothetical protein